jgi:hypothetical protein
MSRYRQIPNLDDIYEAWEARVRVENDKKEASTVVPTEAPMSSPTESLHKFDKKEVLIFHHYDNETKQGHPKQHPR